jgi:phosphate transport system protein
MSHYEERLENDMNHIRNRVAEMAVKAQKGVADAMHALQTGNSKLAYATILADHSINRDMREIDKLCHSFVALHLPSAGHLRLLSSVIRVNIELERIGDYAVTICRESVQLSSPPSGALTRELERIASVTGTMLDQSIKAFNTLNAEMARSTMIMEEQMENDLDIVYAELMANDNKDAVKNLLAIFVVLTQIKRVADQAKNICEETVFAVTGDIKAPKHYKVLFIDEDNSCQSFMAQAIASKNFPGSGSYNSGGRNPAKALDAKTTAFLEQHGVDVGGATPAPIDTSSHALSEQHVIVSLQGPVNNYLDFIPFHTVALEWDVGSGPAGMDETQANKRLEEMYRDIAARVHDLMETLRGEGAP